MMEPIQKKGSHCTSPLAQPKDWQLMFIFSFKAQSLAVLEIKAVPIISLTAFAQNSIEFVLQDLNPGAHFLFLTYKNALHGIIFPHNRALSSALKTCSGASLVAQW